VGRVRARAGLGSSMSDSLVVDSMARKTAPRRPGRQRPIAGADRHPATASSARSPAAESNSRRLAISILRRPNWGLVSSCGGPAPRRSRGGGFMCARCAQRYIADCAVSVHQSRMGPSNIDHTSTHASTRALCRAGTCWFGRVGYGSSSAASAGRPRAGAALRCRPPTPPPPPPVTAIAGGSAWRRLTKRPFRRPSTAVR
jgi:hypothetical protein